jgi:indole-3-glycerol phosphate synthase
MGVLSEILTAKRCEVQELRLRAPNFLRDVNPRLEPRAVSLHRNPGDALRLIAELKFRSPSAGALSRHLDVEGRALAYRAGGASMMSVLCDGAFFDGDYRHLTRARNTCDIPLLCKEFILDEVQLEYAAASGADWVLLIVRCLDQAALERLIAASQRLGLGALVEVHDPAEATIALNAGATIIGVNARDLDTLEMHPEKAAHVLAQLPREVTSLHLSGIKSPVEVAHLANSTVHGALIGEALMRQDDPTALLTSLTQAAANK